MSAGTHWLMRAAIVFAMIFIAIQVMDTDTVRAETVTTTFTGTVYYKNYAAAGASVSVNYGMQTFTTYADVNGTYNLTIPYVGNGKAVLTASYSGDTDQYTWYPEAGAHIDHDFWITPRPANTAYEGPAATFQGNVYYGNATAKNAHVILVYGKYILDQYANDTGYYSITIYYQGMPGRIWAIYGDGRSDDYWPNPGQDGTIVTDIYITPMTGIPTATPEPTATGSTTPAPTAGPSATAATKPAPFPGIALTIMAIAGGCAFLYRLKK